MEASTPRPRARKVLSEAKTVRFSIPDFERRISSLSLDDPPLESSSHVAHGLEWKILVHREEDSGENRYLRFCLHRLANENTQQVTLVCAFKGPGYGDETHEYAFPKGRSIARAFIAYDSDFREDGIPVDDSGTLSIDTTMQVYEKVLPVWYPHSDKTPKWFHTLMNSTKYSDVSIIVSGKEFLLHRCVLEIRASVLCEMCDRQQERRFELDEVDADLFQLLVKFIYKNEFPDLKSIDEAKTVLLLADRLSCQDLKLFAESVMTEKYIMSSNAADLVLVGHALSCALLKESAMFFCSTHAEDVAGTEGWKLLKESPELLAELFLVTNRKPSLGQSNIADRMSVVDLRSALNKRELDVDGSREMLVKRLKSATNAS